MGEQAKETRRNRANDILMWALLAAAISASVWGMWRLDSRSERLFNVVATERACTCPR